MKPNEDFVYVPVTTFSGTVPAETQIDAYTHEGRMGVSLLKVSGERIGRLNKCRGEHSWIDGTTWRKFKVGK